MAKHWQCRIGLIASVCPAVEGVSECQRSYLPVEADNFSAEGSVLRRQ
jgi:hypothetical protein